MRDRSIDGMPMYMVQEMRRLRAEHAALITLSCFLADIVASPRPARATELASVRGMLRDTLTRHLMCEDWALYPRLKASGDPALRRLAKMFVDEMGHIAGDFAAYDARWSDADAIADWPAFRGETLAILAAIGERIEREHRDLYPMADTLAAARAAAAG